MFLKDIHFADSEAENKPSQWWRILNEIDKAIIKYGMAACTQRAICSHITHSIANIYNKNASHFDQVLNGLAKY